MKAFALLLCLSAIIPARAEDVAYKQERDHFAVILHLVSQREALEKCNALHAWPEPVEKAPRGKAIGCNAFNVGTNTCEIWTPRPAAVNDPASDNLGHELLHCYAGRYHE
jgi:hypothetical protein